MTRILTSSAGQQYAVDDEFEERLYGVVEYGSSTEGGYWVEGNLADLLDFLSAEGLI